jgi:hypothetical protein
MLIHSRAILSPQRIQRVQCEILRVSFVLAHLVFVRVLSVMWGQPLSAVRGAQLRYV